LLTANLLDDTHRDGQHNLYWYSKHHHRNQQPIRIRWRAFEGSNGDNLLANMSTPWQAMVYYDSFSACFW
jgi:hypothetical protein